MLAWCQLASKCIYRPRRRRQHCRCHALHQCLKKIRRDFRCPFHAISCILGMLQVDCHGHRIHAFACSLPIILDPDVQAEALYDVRGLFMLRARSTHACDVLGGDHNVCTGNTRRDEFALLVHWGHGRQDDCGMQLASASLHRRSTLCADLPSGIQQWNKHGQRVYASSTNHKFHQFLTWWDNRQVHTGFLCSLFNSYVFPYTLYGCQFLSTSTFALWTRNYVSGPAAFCSGLLELPAWPCWES